MPRRNNATEQEHWCVGTENTPVEKLKVFSTEEEALQCHGAIQCRIFHIFDGQKTIQYRWHGFQWVGVDSPKPVFQHTSSQESTLLTFDPSITAWGWAVVTWSGDIVKTGCIKTTTEGKKRRIRKGDENTKRIAEVNHILLNLIKTYRVTYLLSELQHGSQNASAAMWQGAVTAIPQTLADTLGLGIEWYSEGDSKKCLLGKISATKKETIDAIDKIYKVPWTGTKYIDEAVADALSIYYTASCQSSIFKLLKNK